MEEVRQFFNRLFDSSDWPPRWHCGNWTGFEGWLYIISDLLIWAAYFAIPVVIIKYISKKQGGKFLRLYFLFAAFILACGATHFLDAVAFWIPMYRLSALVRSATAIISWMTVFSLIRYLPIAFSRKTETELETEIQNHNKTELEIKLLNVELAKQARSDTKEISGYKYALDESSIVAITNQKGIITHANNNFCKISKYSREELIGQDHRIINSGHHSKEFIRDLWITIANGKIWKGELKNKAKDGSIYWVDTTIVPFLNEENKPYQYVAIRADITERKIIEENLEKSLKEISDYKYALEESSIVAITDQKGIIKYANDNFCKISKFNREELIGQDHRIINSGHHSKEFIRDLWVTIANGKIWKGELKNKAKDGSIYWVDTTIVPFLNAQGKPYQYIAIRADITERKRVEDLLVANTLFVFQSEEKEKRAAELITANKELAFQNKEKEKRAAELITANKELAFQNEEKEKRATELTIANKELAFQSEEKEKRAAELILANKELAFQNEEKEKRAAELILANKELAFQNQEKEKRAAELTFANKELAFQNEEKEKRAAELTIANKELAFQNEEKEKRATELLIANRELLFQNDEKRKRAAELLETLERVSFLASIADNIQDPVISTDINANITRWNKAAELLFEWKSEEVIGKIADNILKVNYPVETMEQVSEAFKAKGFWQGEVIYHTKSGRPVNVLITASHLKDGRENISGNLVLVRDITERKKTEDQLSALNANLEQKVKERTETVVKTLTEKNIILESIADAFFAVDKNWTVTYWNRVAEKDLAVPRQEIIGKNLWEIFSDSIGSLSYQQYHKSLKNNHVVHFEDHYPALNKWYEISSYPSENGLSIYFKDVTERKKAAEEIKTLNEGLEKKVIERTNQLEVANKELEAFSYSVSHDLRAPLRAVSGYSRILEEDYGIVLDREGKRIIDAIVVNSKRMGQLIDDLLSFSKMARMSVYLFRVDMVAIVQECLGELIPHSPTALYDIVVNENLPKIKADQAMIKQVWMNLISNAIKYSSKKEHPLIEIGFIHEEGMNTYFIRDNGAGFNMDYADKLFGVFQRLHSTEEFSGTGVGLALVSRIINKHNGKVWGEGKEGVGATFYFSLPVI